MRNFGFRFFGVMALIAIVGVGCGTTKIQTYSGAERPQEEIAVLNCDSNLSIESVDENSAYHCSGCEIRFLPGYHTITASFYERFSASCLGASTGGRSSSGSLSTSFHAKAGGSYHLTYKIFGTQCSLIVKESDQK